jgi:hypothetical protein
MVMKNQITTLENYEIKDLCKTGGLQSVYDMSVDASNEICDLTTTKGRKRQKSLAAKVASSKVLFEKACRGYVQDKKAEIKNIVEPAEKEIRQFVKDMDKLRDNTKAPVLALERKEADEVEAYEIVDKMADEARDKARQAEYEAQAKVTAHLEAIIQNMEFDSLNIDASIAKFHCENKGQVFDLEAWEQELDFKENIEPALVYVGNTNEPAIEEKPHFVMPLTQCIGRAIRPSIDFIVQGAAEDIHKHFPMVDLNIAVEICEAIKAGKIENIELVD